MRGRSTPPDVTWDPRPHSGSPVLYSESPHFAPFGVEEGCGPCLLYTSDAADERSSVDLGGRRIIKKTKRKDEGGRDISKTNKRQKMHEKEEVEIAEK